MKPYVRGTDSKSKAQRLQQLFGGRCLCVLDYFYWMSGATLGGLFGNLIHFNTRGLGFVMTAMFVTIFMEQWMKEHDHTASILGLVISAFCLIAFGADSFVVPAMVMMLLCFMSLRSKLEIKQQ